MYLFIYLLVALHMGATMFTECGNKLNIKHALCLLCIIPFLQYLGVILCYLNNYHKQNSSASACWPRLDF